MRFVENGVSEVVVTTDGAEGPNAAPMGLVGAGTGFRLRVFEGATRQNLAEAGEGVLNVTWDPVVFARTALGMEVELERDPVRLSRAAFFVPFSVTGSREASVDDELGESVFTVFEVSLGEAEAGGAEVRVPSQGFCAVLEALVHATRVRVAERRGLDGEAERLRGEMVGAVGEAERFGGDRVREAVGVIREVL